MKRFIKNRKDGKAQHFLNQEVSLDLDKTPSQSEIQYRQEELAGFDWSEDYDLDLYDDPYDDLSGQYDAYEEYQEEFNHNHIQEDYEDSFYNDFFCPQCGKFDNMLHSKCNHGVAEVTNLICKKCKSSVCVCCTDCKNWICTCEF